MKQSGAKSEDVKLKTRLWSFWQKAVKFVKYKINKYIIENGTNELVIKVSLKRFESTLTEEKMGKTE